MNNDNLEELRGIFNSIIEMDDSSSLDIYNIIRSINELYESKIQSIAKGYSRQRIIETLKELSSILDTKLSRFMIDSGEWDPSKDPVRPELIEEENIPPKDDEDDEPTKTSEDDKDNNTSTDKKGCKSDITSSYLIVLLMIMVLSMLVIRKIAIKKQKNIEKEKTFYEKDI